MYTGTKQLSKGTKIVKGLASQSTWQDDMANGMFVSRMSLKLVNITFITGLKATKPTLICFISFLATDKYNLLQVYMQHRNKQSKGIERVEKSEMAPVDEPSLMWMSNFTENYNNSSDGKNSLVTAGWLVICN